MANPLWSQLLVEAAPQGNVQGLSIEGSAVPGNPFRVTFSDQPGTLALFAISAQTSSLQIPGGGELLVDLGLYSQLSDPLPLDASGTLEFGSRVPRLPFGTEFWGQAAFIRTDGTVALSNRIGLATLLEANRFSAAAVGGFFSLSGDVDADGWIDIVSPHGTDSIVIKHGLGERQYGREVPILIGPIAGSSSQYRIVYVGDLDGDSHIDIVVSARDTSVTPVWNNGAGGWHIGAPIPANVHDHNGIAVCDWNQDGLQDLALIEYGAGIWRATAMPGRTFSSLSMVHSGNTNHVRAADFNGDGIRDLCAINRVNGSLQHSMAIAITDPATGSPFVQSAVREGNVSDVSHGSLDSLPGDEIVLLLRLTSTTGTGYREVAEVVNPVGSNSIGISEFQSASPAALPIKIAVGDFDSDNNDDVVIIGSTTLPQEIGFSGFFAGIGDGTLRPEVDFEIGLEVFNAGLTLTTAPIIVGDHDQDGADDLLIGTFSGDLVVHGTGTGSFEPLSITTPVGTDDHWELSHIDSDGTIDLYSRQEWRPGHGDGTFGMAQPFPTSWSGIPIYDIKFSALDGDAIPDAVIRTNPGSGPLTWARGLGGGGFAPLSPLPATGLAAQALLDPADFDLDGDIDILFVAPAQTGQGLAAGAYINDGSGSFTTSPIAIFPGSYALSGDVDGDGVTDLLCREYTGSFYNWHLARGSGSGSFRASILIGTADIQPPLFGADLDGDGFGDVFLNTTPPTILFGDSQGTYSRSTAVSASDGYPRDLRHLIKVEDGRYAVLSRDLAGFSLSTLTGDARLSRAEAHASFDIISRILVGDLDGDNRQDILTFGNSTSGAYAFAYLNQTR